MDNEWFAPIATGSFVLATGLATAITSIVVARRNGDAAKAPTVQQAWDEADAARLRARAWERLYDVVRRAFKAYARRMFDLHGDAATLDDTERAALEAETPKE